MERLIFPSKPSFAVLAWLVILVSLTVTGLIPASYKAVKEAYNKVSDTIIAEAVAKENQFSKIELITDPKKLPKDLRCMAENIYHESSTQSYVGKIAVGLVVLNRAKSDEYPKELCDVIYQGSKNIHTSTCQFSWTCNFHNPINTNSASWKQSVEVAQRLLYKRDTVIDVTEGATYYHADYVKPLWAKSFKQVVQIDQHIFYKSSAR